MFGLTPLGLIHTLISLVAVAAGLVALWRYREIVWSTQAGKIYVIATVLTCLTGFGIFQHGGFGKPHVLGIVTLVVLGVALLAETTQVLGARSPYVRTVAYSTTFMFHWIPAITETTTRLPLGAPLLAGPEDPALQKATAVLLLLLVVGATLQVRRLRRATRLPSGASTA